MLLSTTHRHSTTPDFRRCFPYLAKMYIKENNGNIKNDTDLFLILPFCNYLL